MGKTHKDSYRYGESPNPNSWHQTAEILRQQKQKSASSKKPKGGPSLMDRLDTIESLIKGRS